MAFPSRSGGRRLLRRVDRRLPAPAFPKASRVLPPDDRTDDPQPSEEPRHPFTYRAPAPKAEAEPDPADDLADEVRRNDAVLAAAAGLMAIAFAFTTIADSRVLVHVKTGQYLASHGVLPPRTDAFSATAAERPWVNLGWLFDLMVAGLHAVGGMTALTVFKAVAGLAVALLIFSCRRSGVSSWWASLVVVLAAFAAMPQLDATPLIVTLLGLGVTLRQLTRYRQELDDRALWWLAPVFLVWANLDPRMFLGLALLVLYGLGELVGMLLGRPAFEEGSRRGRYWLAVAASVVASFANPFGWRAPFGPLLLYGEVDPAYRAYYGREVSWASLPHLPLLAYPRAALLDTAILAAFLLAAVALVAMLLNSRRVDFGDVAVWIGFAGFALLAGRELPAAAVVFAVLAIQNAEEWYRVSFRQAYSEERGELLFARGGRAVTVLAFAALAALWLMGKIPPDDARRPGVGLDPLVADQVASLTDLLKDPYDTKVFNFLPAQGDLLIWLGMKPFIDHRLELYAGGSGRDDLIDLHDKVRYALRSPDPDNLDAGRPDVWKPAFEKYGVVQAIPRLSLPSPDYRTYFDLLRSPDWRILGLGAAGAVFYRGDLTDPGLDEYFEKHPLDFARQAFREPAEVPETDGVWPAPRGWMESLTSKPRASAELARALHALQHLEEASNGTINIPPQAALAFGYLALRDFYAAVADDPRNLPAYRGLGRTYELLYFWETRILQLGGSNVQLGRRLYQAIDAYGQALAIDPDDVQVHERLIGLYLGFGKADLAEHARNEYERLTGREPPPQLAEEQWTRTWEQLRGQVDAVNEQARRYAEENKQPIEAAFFAWQNGCTRLALELIDAHPDQVNGNPDLMLFRAMLLLEAARPREAHGMLTTIEPIAVERTMPGFREPFALACLALPDFSRAEALWRDEAAQAAETQLMVAIQAAPLSAPFARPASGFPVLQTAMAWQAAVTVPDQVAKGLFNAALCDLEAGRTGDAEKTFAALLDRYPLSSYLPLAGLYVELIRGKPLNLDLSEPAAAADRYAAVEARLDRGLVARQIEAAGPVEARKPTARPSGVDPAAAPSAVPPQGP